MIFTLTDRMYNVLDAYETDDYLIGQYVGSILETLDINVLTKSIHADLWIRGNYIMCQDKSGRKYWFTIYDDEDGLNDDVKSFSCYSGTIDIVSEEYPPISATQAQPFEWYFNRIFLDTGITLGINEIAGLSRKLEFTSENATNAEMLQFVLNGFDNAEAQLDVKFDGSTPTELVLNVYKRIGEEQPQAILSDEDDSLTDLTRKGSLSELGTSLDLQGAEVDEKTITLAGKYYEEKDVAGNILYYSPKNLTRIFSVKAHEDYYVKLPNKAHGEFDGYINRRYKSEAKTQDALWAEGLARLKKIDHAVVEYDAKGDISCGIGDNVQVVSHTMRPPVMVSARTTEYKFNDDDKERNEYKFSNYVELESHMSELDRIVAELKEYAQQVAKTYIFSINNVGSPMFKNGEGEVIFTAKIEKNNQDTTGEFTEFNWTKQKKDGSLDTTWNEAHKNIGKALTVKPEDFEDTATFSYEALQDDLIYGGASGVVTKVYDGENGKTPIKGVDYFDGKPGTNGLSAYLHVRYSQNANGNPMTSDPTNAVYLGLLVSQNPTASTVPADYDWSMVKGPQGIPGETVNGKTSYLHIKYSNDGGKTFTGNSGEDAGSYLGQYVDFESADSTDVKKYAWSRIEGETPVVHNAYAWSADGTDRFTDTYPGENILTGVTRAKSPKISPYLGATIAYTENQSVSEWEATDAVKHVVTGNTGTHDTIIGTISMGGQVGNLTDTWGHSIYVKNTGTKKVLFSNNLGKAISVEAGQIKRVEIVSKAQNVISARQFVISRSVKTDTLEFILWHAKIEKSATPFEKPTIWTPAPTDDFENAYPTYSGTYTDYTAQDSQTPADYTWSRILGNAGQDGNDGVGIASDPEITYQGSASGTNKPTGTWSTTIPEVPAGQFLWTKTVTTYTNNTNSTAYTVAKMGSDGKPGSAGVSVSAVVEEYYVSTSPTSQAGGSWSTTVPNNANPNLYVFRRMKTTMSNGTVTYTNPALIQGMTGIYPYIGPTQPANPKEEQQWWKSDSSGNITNFYVYKSGSWQGQTIQQSVLNIIALNAVTITGSTITGTDMYGSNFITTFTDVPVPFAGTSKMSGSATLSNGELTIAGTVDNTFPFMTRYTGTGYTLTTYTDSSKTTIRNILAANYDNIVMRDNTKNFGGIIQASMLSNTPWINLNLRTGYAISENNRPQYRVTYNLDGTQHLSFRGQFKKSDNSKMVAGSDQHPFDVPSSLAPATTIMSYGGASTGTGSRPYVTSSGYFGTIIGSSATDYVDISMVTYDI